MIRFGRVSVEFGDAVIDVMEGCMGYSVDLGALGSLSLGCATVSYKMIY